MAKSSIEWTDTTWNPIAGCTIVSSGCTNCYAMEFAKRLELMGIEKYDNLTRKSGSRIIWNGVVKECPEILNEPYKWRKPRKVFVNSMSDLFHENVSDEFIGRIWQVMRETPQHVYQILSKRPTRMKNFLKNADSDILPNVWLGTSVENHEVIDRVDELQSTPAAIRFISCEPLIDSIGKINLDNIHWVIVGGESGKNARPVREEWIDEIFEQCKLTKTSFFFKQWGNWGRDGKKRSKKANGRHYRGSTWDEIPNHKLIKR